MLRSRCCSLIAVIALLTVPMLSSASPFARDDYLFIEDPVTDGVDVRLRLDVGQSWSRADWARIVFCADDDDNGLFLDATATGLSLGKTQQGTEQTIAHADGWAVEPVDGGYDLTIKRRAWSISVLVNGAVALRAYDAFAPGGRIGWAYRSVRISDLYAQPIGEMLLEDDFARPPDEPNPWKALSGAWDTSLPEARNGRAQVAKSANPFSFKTLADNGAEALAIEGSDFWDSYEARVAVKPAAPGQVGLAFHVRGEQDFYLLRITAAEPVDGETHGKAELVRRIAGTEQVLDSKPCDVASGRWHELTVRAFEGSLEGLLNGESVCSATDESIGEGKLGLYARDCAKAFFDDVRLAGYAHYAASFSEGDGLPLQAVSGDWSTTDENLSGSVGRNQPTALAVTGDEKWADYALAADVTPGSARAVGIRFGQLDDANYYEFRWGRSQVKPREFVQELASVTNGERTVLAKRTAALSRRQTYRVECILDRAYAAVLVDGECALDAVDFSRTSAGRIGFLVDGPQGAAAKFDNVDVRFLPLPADPVSITEQFAQEDTMANWARPAASWEQVASGVSRYALPVWGDFIIRTRIVPASKLTAPWVLAIAASGQADNIADAGPVLSITGKAAGAEASVVVASEEPKPFSLGETGASVEIERRGGCVIARIDDEPVAWTRIGNGRAAPHVALKLTGSCVSLNETSLTSPNIIDEAFASAPVGWNPGAGNWDVSDRWHCSPQWSWLCGRDTETPLLWLRRPVGGDIVVEYWGAMMMDLTEAPHYSHPSDLNTVICGDGKQLCSGYGLVFAGENNKAGRILRKGEKVAETSDFVFVNPIGGNRNFHNIWFHTRVERTGGHLKFMADDHKPLEYDDPSPLGDGHVGIWSHQGNGILVARARIAFQN